MKAVSSALTAFCLSSNRHYRRLSIPLRAASDDPTSADSYQPISPTQASSPAQDKKDWFVDGKETARRLKIELGLMSEESDEIDDNNGDDGLSSTSIEASSREEAMESGRKAALEFLKSLNDDDDDVDENGTPQTKEEQTDSDTPETAIEQSSTQFTYPSRKSHCLTICLVPPPSATTAWERLSNVRLKLKDPGFFRWPPHANLLYPFLEPSFDKESDNSKEEQQIEFREQLSRSLTSVASQCKPFDIEIDTFGTFGGKDRGVLWAHPRSKYPVPTAADYESDDEPLIALQALLEKQFPPCTDQRKQGSFTPHMTLSHYANITDALEAKERVESEWESTSFHVPEIYLLERKGDEGQFKILAKIPLGLEKDDEVKLLDEPLAFPAMPIEEEEWVYNERMTMKNRRKNNFKRRRRGGRSNDK